MIDKTLQELEQKIQQSNSIPGEKKKELIRLLSALKFEIVDLAATKKEEAESIAGFTELSASESIRSKKNPQLLDISLKGLAASAEDFEVSHPKLVQAVNAVCSILAKMGI